MRETLIDFRCSNCNKLLGKIEGMAEIKCPKCKRVNVTPKLFESYIIGVDSQGREYPRPGSVIPIGIVIGKV